MTDRLKENITILDMHNKTHRSVKKLTNGKKYELELMHEIVDDVASILNKMENHILVELPCKVGTEVLGVFDNDDEHKKEIYCGKVLCFTLDECNVLWAKMKYACGLSYWHTIDDFGKTVFLTKEEAEIALKKRGKENECI